MSVSELVISRQTNRKNPNASRSGFFYASTCEAGAMSVFLIHTDDASYTLWFSIFPSLTASLVTVRIEIGARRILAIEVKPTDEKIHDTPNAYDDDEGENAP
jgi:uncharacterized membrane protein